MRRCLQFERWSFSLWLASIVVACSTRAQASVLINEFMAANEHTLTNQLGLTSDWLELINTTDAAANLTGWFLTDDANRLNKWPFPPSVTIPPFGYRLVHLSDAANGWTNGELHATFKLSADGEYLALVRPDLSVASAYSPTFPNQSTDVSFGLRPAISNFTLVARGAPYRYRVPTGTESTNWNNAGFDDATWASGTGPLGYDARPAGDLDPVIETVLPATPRGVYRRQTFVLGAAPAVDQLTLNVKFDDGFVVYLNGQRILTINAPIPAAWNSLAEFEHPNSDALIDQEFDISAAAPFLHSGTNVLAVHALTISSHPSIADLLVDVVLEGATYTPGASSQLRFFHTPTPGARNVLGDDDFLRPVIFSHDRGFYDAPFSLSLTANLPQHAIWYTLDGSVPVTNLARFYTGPFSIATTTVVRAWALRAGYEPSPVATHTFVFPADVGRQVTMNSTVAFDPVLGPQIPNALKSLPTIAITTDYSNLFSATTGIYANYYGDGPTWERPVSLEWIDPANVSEIQQDAGIRIYGGYFRAANKKSFRLLFKNAYSSGKLNFPVFPDPTAVTAFDTFILRAGGNDSFANNGLIDPFVRRCQQAAWGNASRSTFVHLYLNGQYWGIYNPSERADQAFAASYYGGDKNTEWDAMNAGFPTGESRIDSYQAMTAAVAAAIDNPSYQRLRGCNPDGSRNPAFTVHLDIDSHIDYILTHIWGGTGDWPYHNWYAAGSRTNSNGWMFYVWDSEWSLSALTANIAGTPGPTDLQSALRQNPEYRLRFADRVRRHLLDGGALTPGPLVQRYQDMVNTVQPGIVANAARWGSVSTPSVWQNNQNSLLAYYLPNRTAVVLGQLRAIGLYPTIDAPVFSHPGGVFSNALTLTISASNAVYFTVDASDPRTPGTGAIRGTPYAAPLILTANSWVSARARAPDGTWSALTQAFFTADALRALRITELMPNPAAPAPGSPFTASDFEFIELHNPGAQSLNLAHLAFTEGAQLVLPAFILNPGEHAVVVKNPLAFATRYGGGPRIAGTYTDTLDNAGERVVLRASSAGPVVAEFTFGNGRGWPPAADGAGHSLVPLVTSEQDAGALDAAANWRASAFRHGSPGLADPAPLRDLLINEIVAHTDYSNAALPEYDSNDWAELFNTANANVPLANWFLSDDPDNLAKWPIPPSTVATTGAWLVFDEVTGFHSPITNGFGLNKAGETLLLAYLPGTAADRVADAVPFKGQEPDTAWARYSDGVDAWYPLTPTPGSANGLPALRVVFSEVMYHPAPTAAHPEDNTHDEYVELQNAGTNAVQLWTAAGTWRLAGAVQFTFPTNTILAPGEHVLITAFDPADTAARQAFMLAYGLTNLPAQSFGPFDGQLSNRGERLALERPQAPDLPGDPVSWVIVDEVIYADRDPWPGNPDGLGFTLQRVDTRLAGTTLAAWSGEYAPSPGTRRAKISLVLPQNDAVIFTRTAVPVQVSVDDAQVVGLAAGGYLLVDGAVAADQPGPPPYAFTLGARTNAGSLNLRAVVADASGSTTSAVTALRVLDVRNGATAERVTDLAARLSGELVGPGSADVSLYWGRVDGGTNPAAWEFSGSIGARQAGPFLADIAGLTPGQPCYYRASARNSSQTGWGQASGSFTSATYRAWSHRLRITFAGYTRPSTLLDFPALVSLSTNLPGFAYADFAPGAADLRFTDGLDGRPLPYEIEHWNTNGISSVWVRLPALNTASNFIHMLWGQPNASEPPPFALQGTAWEDRFHAVWHYSDSLVDSTANRVSADNLGTTSATGIVAGARWFNGTSAYIDPRVDRAWYGSSIENLTLSFWVRPDTVSPGPPFGVNDLVTNDVLSIRTHRGNWLFTAKNASRSTFTSQSAAWQLLTLVLDHGEARAYRNDEPTQIVGNYDTFLPADAPYIGSFRGGAEFFAGTIDEIQLSDTVRSDDWIWAHYRNVAQNAAFLSLTADPYAPFDDDADGMPDAWENRHFQSFSSTNALPEADPDGDGMSNDDEYIAGTDPMDDADVFALHLSGSGTNLTVGMPTVTTGGEDYPSLTRRYALESAPAAIGPWSGVNGLTNIPAPGTVVEFAPAGFTTNGTALFRARLWLTPAQ